MESPSNAFHDPAGFLHNRSASTYANFKADGDPHDNAGIPNRAFCLAAKRIGGRSWEMIGHIWYEALTDPTSDKLFAFDYLGAGKLEHLVLYSPGNATFVIFRNKTGNFEIIHKGTGFGSRLNLLNTNDRMFPIDYTGTGKLDHLAAYRPGSGIFVIAKARDITDNHDGTLKVPYVIATLDVNHFDFPEVKAFAFDYTGSGRHDYLSSDHVLVYRTGHNCQFKHPKESRLWQISVPRLHFYRFGIGHYQYFHPIRLQPHWESRPPVAIDANHRNPYNFFKHERQLQGSTQARPSCQYRRLRSYLSR